ncbi:hypothetical protein [Geomicrobium sp. JCM 19039]|uniref:hypothetical protein n=1 Tax=Geomicrobium sp. JCM 19039 TaxID=1460636 RepID=UPI00045F2105|nr:hypothetical protein [Geomicrobium sp. JCM 19039]GAK12139.1 hypothetical protein JCM19039_1879 [Geomicrobium sp. JCM 19039]
MIRWLLKCFCFRPQTLKGLLYKKVGKQVQVFTPFGVVSGTVVAVRGDYVVQIDADDREVLTNLWKIEMINEI